MKYVESFFDLTGNMVRDWADAGYRCVCYDIQHPREGRFEGNIHFVHADLLEMNPDDRLPASIRFAFPPCTGGAVSGTRWWKAKGLRGLIDWLVTFEAARRLVEGDGVPWMIEQPVVDTVIARRWREPDHWFDPCDFGDPYTKRTQLWTGGGFVMPSPEAAPLYGVGSTRVEPVEGSKMHGIGPSEDRANLRSETPRGFARAVFDANHHCLEVVDTDTQESEA